MTRTGVAFLAYSGLALTLTLRMFAQETPAPAPAPPPQPHLTAPQQLAEAGRVLGGVPEQSLRPGTKKNLAQLRKDFGMLTAHYTESPAATAVWQDAIYDVERDVVLLVGGGGVEEIPAPKPLPGLPVEVSDPDARKALETFRTHIELFYDAATARLVPAP